MNTLPLAPDYKNWLIELKAKIKQSQIKAAIAVNSQLIMLYWDMGRQITDKQENAKWGTGFINQLSKDLKAEFPDMGGFSKRNLEIMRQWFLFYNQLNTIAKQPVSQLVHDKTSLQVERQTLVGLHQNELEIIHQSGGNLEKRKLSKTKQSVSQFKNIELANPLFQIPWGHHVVIIQKIKNQNEAIFYMQQTIENNWSRSVLQMQIETNLFGRQGKAISNFKNTLPEADSDLAIALLKDPYNFEFLTLGKQLKERDLEQKLIENISRFLLELGKGFAYMGRQFVVNVGGKDFKTDLLFYHTKLKCYIIIELKTVEFEPEILGKLNFYLSAIDALVKDAADRPTIGILLCKNKNNVVVDFALKDINKPMGISEFTYTQLSEEIKLALPTIEQLTNQLNQED